jgi:heparin/heparan-sulfate lyase
MSIALYDEDPVPYQYCAYRILEELVPMRSFEYQSPRHSQGIGYGIYRFGWDMHAAWLLYRMSGKKVFASNIEDVSKYWLYMRHPGHICLPDGDGSTDGRRINMGQTGLLTSAYSNDPIMKYDYLRQGGLPGDPILSLLVNDPDLAPADDLSSLPLTLDFGPILGGMVARTGWNMDNASSDVVVMMTGGGYHFNNHQHADAGSFQIYFHGSQITDLGQYVFYGTPYDVNFNKRSVAHSMMLAFDPDEKESKTRINDGGEKFVSPSPRNMQTVKSDPRYANGTIISRSFGPSPQESEFTYFSVNLTSAYGPKLENYVRTFCFLNLRDAHTPAALIVLDNMVTSSPKIKKYWQINTLNAPKKIPNGLLLSSNDDGTTGYVSVKMLRPAVTNRLTEILSGEESTTVFGHHFTPPRPNAPQTHGHRIMFSPAKPAKSDTFLSVMTMSEDPAANLPVDVAESDDIFALTLADRTIVLSKTGELVKRSFNVETKGPATELLLTGLAPGSWTIKDVAGKAVHRIEIQKQKNTALHTVPAGRYIVELVR